MPLPYSGPREELHIRQIDMRGYRRPDGMFEIEGRVNDRKTYPLNLPTGRSIGPGDFIHDMWVRLVIDDNMVVQDAIAVSDSVPMASCKGAEPTLKNIVGLRIAAGWTNAVKRVLGGSRSCTHLMELLIPLGTAAFQSLSPVRNARPDPLDAHGKPTKIGRCWSYDSGREGVMKRWPQFYTGPDAEEVRRKVIPLVAV